MTAPTNEACQSWLTDDDWSSCKLPDVTDDEKATSGLWASTWAWRVCERQIGVCTYTRTFCHQWRCRCEPFRCVCGPRSRIDLGQRPVVSVTSAVISTPAATLLGPIAATDDDAAVLSQLQVIDHRWLIRADGEPWPVCPATVTPIWSAGVVPDVVDRGAVLALAIEHVKKGRCQPCALPDGMQQIRTGNGSAITMIDPFDKRLKGLPAIPDFFNWALAFFDQGAGGGLMDPAEHVRSYEVTWP